MHMPPYIKFLGTAGARFAVARQLRSSAGVFLHLNGKNIMLDPGPGTLQRMAGTKPKLDVTELDAIILTHAHIDHSNDVNILIDGMHTRRGASKGILFAPRECVHGENSILFNYLKGYLSDIVILEETSHYELGDLDFATSVRHHHAVETYGLSFFLDDLKLSFMVDTKYNVDLLPSYQNSDILVMNVVMKDYIRANIMHLCIDDVKEIITQLHPKIAVITHFGVSMLTARPEQIAQDLSRETGIKVIAATDDMAIDLDTNNL